MELLLYDGTTTLNLADGVAFGLPYDEWTPNVARRRLDVLGGRSPYEPVEERIPLHARGATGAEALGHVQTLARMMDQAARWWRGDVGVTAVQLWYKPTGSTLGGYLKNAVVPSGRGGLVGLSPRVNDASNYEIPGIELYVLRVEGVWLFDAYEVENYALNSSFEVFASGNFANWTKNGTPTLSQVPALVQGNWAALVASAAAGSQGFYQDVSLPDGVNFRVSMYVRRTAGTGTIILNVFNYGGFVSGISTSTSSSSVVRLEVTKLTASGGLRIFVGTTTPGTQFEIDGVMVEEGSVATDYHPNSDEVFVATVAETGNPNVLTADWSVSGIAGNDCPVALSLTSLENNSSRFFDAGALVHVTGDVIEPLLIEAEDCTASAPGGGTFASAVVSGARGGDVMRLTPGAVGDYTLEYSGDAVGTRWAVFLMLKQATSGAVGYTISLDFERVTLGNVGQSETLYLSADDFDGNPTYISLGTISTSQPEVTKFTITFTPAATSATVLDVDFVVLAAIDDDGGIITLSPWLGASVIVYTLEVDSQVLSAPVPLVAAVSTVGSPTTLKLGYAGNAFLTQRGYTMSAVPLLKQGADWLYQEAGGGEMDFMLTATRKLAFLTPE